MIKDMKHAKAVRQWIKKNLTPTNTSIIFEEVMKTIESKQLNENLGRTASDVITGFSGVITGYSQYITGCDQYLLTPKATDSSKDVERVWIDCSRLEIIGESKVQLGDSSQVTKPGADKPAPVK